MLRLILLLCGLIGTIHADFPNFQTDSWMLMNPPPTVPPARCAHSAVLNPTNDTMIVFGGWDNSANVYNQILKYFIYNDQWIPVTPIGMAPRARYAHSAITTLNNMMIIFGGRNQTSFFNDVGVYNLLTDTWVPITVSGVPPVARAYHSAVLVPLLNQMMVFGGVDASGIYYNDLWTLDLISFTWTAFQYNGTMPIARQGHSAIYTPLNDMVIFGGAADSSLQDVARFNVPSRRWITNAVSSAHPEGTTLPNPRVQHTAVYCPLGIMVVWGGLSDSGSALGEVWNLDLNLWNWTQAVPSGGGTFNARAGHASVATPFGTMLSFGGYASSSVIFGDTGKYNMVTSVIRSANDGVMAVIVMTICGSIMIAMCFAVSWINEQAEKEKQEAIDQALAEHRRVQPKPRPPTKESVIAMKTQHFLHKVRENLDPLRDPSKNFS